jgi:RHS repeat-associated protein
LPVDIPLTATSTQGDGIVDYFTADVVSYSDYLPFGQIMPNRHGYTGTKYRFGFQDQEVDDELKGEDNSVNYAFRMHDPRIGRFLSIDPLAFKFPYYSPYHFASNSTIISVELEGLENSIQINFVEGKTVNIYRTSYGALEVDMVNFENIPPDQKVPTNGTQMYTDARPGGKVFVQVNGRFDYYNNPLVIAIYIPKTAEVLTDEQIEAKNEQQNLKTNNVEVQEDKSTQSDEDSFDKLGKTKSTPIIQENKSKTTDKTKPKQLSNAQIQKLDKKLEGASIFSLTAGSTSTDIDWTVSKSNVPGSVGNIMQSYRGQDLSNIKLNVNVVLGGANKNERNYDKTRRITSELRREFIRAGFNSNNIHINTTRNMKSERHEFNVRISK